MTTMLSPGPGIARPAAWTARRAWRWWNAT